MLEIYGDTHIGQVREDNQDRFHIGTGWAVVADGMGGHQGGALASGLAVSEITAVIDGGGTFQQAVDRANEQVYNKALSDPAYAGMGTTVVLCGIQGATATFVHVGDSRAYVVDGQGIRQVTRDHSVVQQLIDSGTITPEQARFHPQKNLITRAVGTEKRVMAECSVVKLEAGACVVLCSDGLNTCVEDGEIERLVRQYPPREAVGRLIDAANGNGGRDNITVVLMKRS